MASGMQSQRAITGSGENYRLAKGPGRWRSPWFNSQLQTTFSGGLDASCYIRLAHQPGNAPRHQTLGWSASCRGGHAERRQDSARDPAGRSRSGAVAVPHASSRSRSQSRADC